MLREYERVLFPTKINSMTLYIYGLQTPKLNKNSQHLYFIARVCIHETQTGYTPKQKTKKQHIKRYKHNTYIPCLHFFGKVLLKVADGS